jgi:DNA-binding NtrC family response regulator
VYGIVTQHGGSVDVRSEPGKGTCFEILLPRFDGPDAPPPEHAEGSVSEAPLGRGERILVVDDHEAVRAVIEEALVHDGYRVTATARPSEALRIARELGSELDMLITDVVMPAMSGRDLATEIKREFPHLSILLISGYADDVFAGPNGHAFDFLRKPLRIAPLRSKVHGLLEHRKRR